MRIRFAASPSFAINQFKLGKFKRKCVSVLHVARCLKIYTEPITITFSRAMNHLKRWRQQFQTLPIYIQLKFTWSDNAGFSRHVLWSRVNVFNRLGGFRYSSFRLCVTSSFQHRFDQEFAVTLTGKFYALEHLMEFAFSLGCF